MNMCNKATKSLLFKTALVVGLAGWPAIGLTSSAQADPVRIGFLTTLSGPIGLSGAEMKRGLELALEQLGGKIGGQPTEVFTVDDKGNTNAAVQGLSELIDKDKVDFLTGPVTSNIVMAILPTVAKSDAFLLSPNAGPNPAAGPQCNPNLFGVGIQGDAIAGAMGLYLKKIGKHKLYLTGQDYQAGWDMLGAAARTYDGPIAGKVFTPMAQFDFASEFARLREADPDSVFAFYTGGAAISFVKQYAQLKDSGQASAPLYSPALADPLLFKAEGDAALGINIIDNYDPEAKNPANAKLVAAYRQKFQRFPTHYAALQYDTVMLLDSAIRAVNGNLSDKAALRAAIRKADFQSVRGKFKFNTNQFPIQDYYVLQVKKNAEGELTMAYVTTAAENYADPYAKDCPMK
jgi:branched-chain amino acid transport system substrate-binding protein